MSYKLNLEIPIGINIKRIIRELDEKIINEILYSGKPKHEIIHYVRKRCKEIRGTLRFLRPKHEFIYKKENTCYRDAAHEISLVRDLQSRVEATDRLFKHFKNQLDKESHQFIYDYLIEVRNEIYNNKDKLDGLLISFSKKIKIAQGRVNFWPIKNKGFKTINKGLLKTYRCGKRAMIKAYKKPNTKNFHEWRKRVKYHWFHLQLISPIWPKYIKSYIAEIEQLAEQLGDEHDLANLKEILLDKKWEKNKMPQIKNLIHFIDKKRNEIRDYAYPVGKRLFFERPGSVSKRFENYWSLAEKQLIRKN